AYAGACRALYSYQRKLIFRPLPDIIRTPADIGLPYEDVWIPTDLRANQPTDLLANPLVNSLVNPLTDQPNEQLHGWWLPNPGNRQTLLFCHGNYGNISYNLERIHFYYNLGFSVLAFDYRGYGQSVSTNLIKPVPTESSTCADAETAWQYLTQTRKIRPENITIMGHSMGGAIAINLAAQHPNAAHLIVASSFTTMQDAVHAKKIYGLFPIQQLLTEPFDSLSKVQKLRMPVLYVHGEQDRDVPAEMSQRLYEASPQPKQLWLVPDSGHNDIATTAAAQYQKTVEAFLDSAQNSSQSSAVTVAA
ncbi:MAG: alpha/beta hydrolase, partial [Phormidesmis sp.]